MKPLLTFTAANCNCRNIGQDPKLMIAHCLVRLGMTGDEILSVNGRQVEGLSHAEVVALFRGSKGTVFIQIGRKKASKERESLYATTAQMTVAPQAVPQLVALPPI